jgi:UDP-3-O-acyl N-acetylglucosamine deacetylase
MEKKPMSRSSAPNRDSQKTIARSFSLSGIGIHSGEECVATFRPAHADCGIYFKIKERKIPARLEYVSDTTRGTALSGIHVVEHILAAAFGAGIDNLEIELSVAEPPILDGSSAPFLKALKNAGTVEQPSPRPVITINKHFMVKDGDSSIRVLPYDGFKVHFMIEFPYIGRQEYTFSDDFDANIAPARTFGLIDELDQLKKRGLARGASLDNSLAIGQAGYINPPRFANEPVRHKILDLIGDISLVGCAVKGEFIALKSGHKLNIELARRILEL